MHFIGEETYRVYIRVVHDNRRLSMLLPFLPLYIQQLGVTSSSAVVQWSGVAFGVTFLGTALTASIWGRPADRFGRKPMPVRAAGRWSGLSWRVRRLAAC
jgi:MFS family permease